jgi:hypothetical protein
MNFWRSKRAPASALSDKKEEAVAVNDTTLPIPNPTEAIVDRNRYLTPKWFVVFKRLLEVMRTTANAMTTVQETVDQIEGTWTLSINSNNRATGYIKLDGSEVSTTFAVMADKFTVVHPSANGTTIEAFIATIVEGVPTLGINGNVIIVGNLAAISADLGTVTAGRIVSPDGRLDINALEGTTPYIRLTNT